MSRDTSRKEAAGIVLFFVAIAIILIFYLPVTLTGIIGAAVKSFFLGLIGVAAYAIPVYILYVALDVFFEKRQGVSGIRVRSIILLLVSVSALLALVSMDMDYFEKICENAEGKTSALKALSLLWESGTESAKITNPLSTGPVLTGGIIGGSIAVALFQVTGKVISVLAIVVFLLTQILLVFRVSLKATAKKTAQAIATTSGKVYSSVVSHKHQNQKDPNYQIYSGNGYGSTNTQRPQQQRRPAGTTVITYGDNGMISPNNRTSGSSPFVQNQIHMSSEKQGPFMTNLPIDGATGFTDVEKLTEGQIHPVSQEPGKLTFNEKEYDVTKGADADADFAYTTDPVSVPGSAKLKKKRKGLSFLENDKEQDFYDLDPSAKKTPEPDYEGDIFSGTEDPYEISEDAEGSGYDYSEPERSVREPRIKPSMYDKLTEGGAPQEVPYTAPVAPAADNSGITINAGNDNTESFSRTEGRILKTSSHEKAPDFFRY